MHPRRFALSAALLFPLAAWSDPLVDVIDRGNARVVVDGVLREWSGALAAIDDRSQVIRGDGAWTGPDDGAMAFAIARDDEGLLVVADVRDDQVIRTRQHAPGEDAIVVTMGFPNGRLWTLWEIAIHPGEPGSFAGAVRYRVPSVRPVPGAQVVEAPQPNGSGFTLEARIPWTAVPGLRDNLAAARFRVAYHDADRGGVTELANGGGDVRHPQELPPTVAAAPAVAAAAVDQLARFRREHGNLDARPLLERAGDLMGAGGVERVAVLPRHLVAWGPEIGGGASYTFLEFPSGQVTSAQLRDLNGDHKLDVVLTLHASAGAFERELLHVYVMDGERFVRVFARETGRTQGPSQLTNNVSYNGGRVTFTVGESRGFNAGTWPNSAEAGVDAPVTPWGAHRAETYAWSPATRSFTLESSVPNPTAPPMPGSPATASAASDEGPTEAPVPGPDVTGVLALFRQREHLPADARPTHRVTGDVAEDATPEQLYVFGHTLVVVGARYMGGRAYSSVGLAANEGDEVLSLRGADLTGDGRMEAVVTIRRAVTVQVRGAPLASRRDMVFVYGFDPAHRGRLFAAEVARRVDDAAVVNRVTLPRGRGGEFVIEAGAARGWTQETYPFHDAAPQGFEALLLPWAPPSRVAYRWNGSAVVRAP